jgi:hypothetical protein
LICQINKQKIVICNQKYLDPPKDFSEKSNFSLFVLYFTFMQEEGGSIWERFTQALARVRMLDWDHEFLKEASANKVDMLLYRRYVDNGNQSLRYLLMGTRLNEVERKMNVMEDLVGQDAGLPADNRSLKEILNMGPSINPMIQLTGDCPSNNQSSKIPVIDLQCLIGDE